METGEYWRRCSLVEEDDYEQEKGRDGNLLSNNVPKLMRTITSFMVLHDIIIVVTKNSPQRRERGVGADEREHKFILGAVGN